MAPKERASGSGAPVRPVGQGPDAGEGQREAIRELQHAFYALSAAERRLNWRAKRSRQSFSPERLRVLSALLEVAEATHGQLVREAELTKASVSAIVDQLEGRRLVRRRPDPVDGR